jgi:hypothetical protein
MPGNLFTIILLAGFGWSCHQKLNPAQAGSGNNKGLLFLAYELKRDSAKGPISVSVLHQFVKEGALRRSATQALADKALEIRMLDKDGVLIKNLFQPDPFIKRHESVNENGALGRVEVVDNRAEIIIRTSYDERIKIISLFLADSSHKARPIFSHELALK